jgi:DNA-binding NarL/FixJ family response regulator
MISPRGRSIDSRKIRVLIADDHAGMLKVVSAFLSEHFCVVAAVSCGDELIRTAVESRPDVIVSDIDISVRDGLDVVLALKTLGLDVLDMPVCDGFDVMLALRTLELEVPFVLLGTDTKGAAQFLDKGAAAYVHKYDIHADLMEAVLLAANGGKFVSRSAVQGGRPSH